MANHKKHKKAQRMRRNAAPPPRALVPRNVTPRPRVRTSAGDVDIHPDTPGWRALKAAGGALATTVAGAYLARQDWLPPKALTGVISALGAAFAVGSPNPTVRSLGLGAMSAAGGQLGFMLIDEQLLKHGDEKREVVTSHQISPPKKPANASDIPADALARAYERARLRMALASDAPN